MKNIPQRTCSVCRAQKNKNELIRVVRNKENKVQVDEIGKLAGRGAYICCDMQCLKNAQKNKKIEKALDVQLSDEIYEQMKKIIEKKNGG